MRASSGSDLPQRRIAAAAETLGTTAFAARCAAVLAGEDADADLIRVLAGRAAAWFLSREGDALDYWQRVWAARGLLWAWNEVAVPAVVASFDDEAWRVREMAAKVVARHRVDAALEAAVSLRADPVPRVRAAATRAVAVLTAG